MKLTEEKKQILVVEDEGLIAADIRRQLTRLGYAVPAVASTGEEALRFARSTPFDLVLMDIHLKGHMDGIATALALKDELRMPVVYITAHADPETVHRAAITEPLGYILKPITDGDLRSGVQIALHKHEMDRRLRTSEAWLSTTLHSVGEGIVATNPTGEIVFMNPVAEQLTGWSAAAAHGRLLIDVLALLTEPDGEPANNPVFDLPDGATRCYTLMSPAGAATPVEVECFENRSDDDLLGSIVAVRNIAARQEADARFLQSQRMEAVAGMAGALAHDFDDPLTTILGHADVLCESVAGALREAAQAIHEAASRAASTTSRLLALSRRDVARAEVLNLNQLIRETVPDLAHALGQTALVTALGSPQGIVRGDRRQLRQALFSLALRARDASPSGGELRIETAITDQSRDCKGAVEGLPNQETGGFVRLRLTDNGSSLDPVALSRIFEPGDTGAGLGLSMAYTIVARHGGSIRATAVGQGTCFEILLPCLGTFQPAADESAPTILLVEGEDSVRGLMHKSLGRAGYQLLEARSAAHAAEIAALYPGPIDLLITGSVVPGLVLKTIFVSGYRHDTPQHQSLLHLGANLLTRPFPAPELLKRVRAVLGGTGFSRSPVPRS